MAAGDSDVVADAIADSKYAADISRKMQVLHFFRQSLIMLDERAFLSF